MTTKRSGSAPKLLAVKQADRSFAEGPLHPGWVHATAILLRGMQRLEMQRLEEGEPAAE